MFFKKEPVRVICIGSTSKDIFFPTDEGIVIETPEDITAKEKVAFELGGKYRVDDRYEAVGGVAANVATGLSRLGHRAACYSKVGGDDIGRWVIENLKKENVDREHLFVEPGIKTDLSAIIVLTQNAERTIFHNRDANERLEVFEDQLTETEWLFVSALNGDWQDNIGKILSAKRKGNLKLALNPGQHNIKSDADTVLGVVAETDILLLNKDEAIELALQADAPLSGESLDDEKFLLEFLFRNGAQMIGMTDGKRGAWGYDGREYWYCPIHTRSKAIDSTGAGDAFGSGFFGAILLGKTLGEALAYGMANSGSVVGYYGAGEGLLRKDEIERIVSHIVPKRLD